MRLDASLLTGEQEVKAGEKAAATAWHRPAPHRGGKGTPELKPRRRKCRKDGEAPPSAAPAED